MGQKISESTTNLAAVKNISFRNAIFISDHFLLRDEKTSIEDHIKATLDSALLTFKSHGAELTDITKLNVYIDKKYVSQFNTAYDSLFHTTPLALTIIEIENLEKIVQVDGIALVKRYPTISYVLRDPGFWRIFVLSGVIGISLPLIFWFLLILFSHQLEL